MTALYDDFLVEVLPYVPECPENVAVNAVRNACIEFCEKSEYWLYNHPLISTIADQGTYALTLPTGSTLACVVNAWHTNMPLIPVGEDEISDIYPLNWTTLKGTPRYLIQKIPNEVQFSPIPAAALANAITLILALKPTRDSVGVPDDLFQNWAESIGYGARARIHALPNQPFTDLTAAMNYGRMFRTEIGKATINRNRGLSRTVKRVRPPRFF